MIDSPRQAAGSGGGGPHGHDFHPGERLAGRYRLKRWLGRGGMGEVFEADDEELTIPLALKTLAPALRDHPSAVLRLKREVLLARSVAHPHVCRVYDLGRHGGHADAVWFLTMELLRGETLQDRLSAGGRMTPGQVLPLAAQMAGALGAAHRAGTVHRDFKSANVMLVPDGSGERAVVTDFGLARPISQPLGDAHLTGSGMVVGTPDYLAPEQVKGDEPGPAADIYALGVVL